MNSISTTRPKIFALSIAALLLIPLIAMQFTEEVNWVFFDFVVAAVLLLGLGIGLEVIFRTSKTASRKFLLITGLVLVLLLVWIELAVGLFGSPLAGS